MTCSVSALEPFVHQRTVLLTTYKRDGTPIGTPVNIVVDGDHAYFRTYDKAWKAKRIRNNPIVEMAPSTARGKPTGELVRGEARLLTGDEAEPARHALRRKYPLLQGVFVLLYHRLARYKTLHYELTVT
jgi:PPOX class probable F420-dependent enzyme